LVHANAPEYFIKVGHKLSLAISTVAALLTARSCTTLKATTSSRRMWRRVANVATDLIACERRCIGGADGDHEARCVGGTGRCEAQLAPLLRWANKRKCLRVREGGRPDRFRSDQGGAMGEELLTVCPLIRYADEEISAWPADRTRRNHQPQRHNRVRAYDSCGSRLQL